MFLSSLDPTPFFPTADSTIKFDWITIIYLVILVLGILVGLKKGFFKTLINALGGIIVIVVAFLLAKPVGALLFESNLSTGVLNSVTEWLVNQNASMNVAVPVEYAAEALPAALGEIGIPAALIDTLYSVMEPFIPVSGTFTPAEVIGLGLTNYIFIAGAFVVLAIVLFIVLAILKKVFEKITELPFIRGVDKLLGGVLGLVFGVLIICVVSYGLTFLTSIPACNDFITGQMYLNDDSVWTLSKSIYNYNFVGQLFELYL